MKHTPVILSLESATSVCSVAISQGNELLAVRETTEGNKHSRWMTIFIEEALAIANLTYDTIDAIAVSAGPGSYTGLRVAYSIAKGIAYSREIPMIEINTLDALSSSYMAENDLVDNSVVIPMIDARRMEVYWHIKSADGNIIRPMEAHILEDTSLDEFDYKAEIILVGDGATKVSKLSLSDNLQSKVQIMDILCSAKLLRYAANEKWLAKDFSNVAYCNPTYLKSPNITKSKKNILSS